MRCENGCTRLNGTVSHKFEGKSLRKGLQWIQVLVPLRHPSLNPNVRCLRRCFRIGYSDKEPPFEERIFFDTWDIFSSKHWARCYQDALRDWSQVVSTNQSPRHVARIVQEIVFRATPRFECCSRVLNQYHRIKEGLTHPRPTLWDAEGPWLK